MKLSQYSPIRNCVVTVMLVVFAMLITISPVLANTSNWSFQSTVDGRYLDGLANGVRHVMTAGTLTNSGSIWATSAIPGANTNANPWTFEVWKEVTGLDPKICSVVVTPRTALNSPVSFSKGCGSITAGTYYLIIFRSASDGRAYAGSGNLRT